MSTALDINYETAVRLCRKCRILMAQSNSRKVLDSLFYEGDVANIGSKSEGKSGKASEQQPFLVILSTDKENQYPRYLKLCLIPTENKLYISL